MMTSRICSTPTSDSKRICRRSQSVAAHIAVSDDRSLHGGVRRLRGSQVTGSTARACVVAPAAAGWHADPASGRDRSVRWASVSSSRARSWHGYCAQVLRWAVRSAGFGKAVFCRQKQCARENPDGCAREAPPSDKNGKLICERMPENLSVRPTVRSGCAANRSPAAH